MTDKLDHWRVLKLGVNVTSVAPDSYARSVAAGFDVGCTYEQWRRSYPNFHAMPTKTKEAVAVLKMNQDGEKTEGIGRRVSENTFWLEDNPVILAEYEEER